MPHAKTQKVRLIVAFADISGFSNFCDAVTNDEVEYDPLMDRFDEIVEKAERETGYSFTDTGDGFMCTVDLVPGNAGRTTLQVLTHLWRILTEIEAAIDTHRKDSVSPEGARVVIAAGYVKRKIKKDGRVILRGKYINLAHNFLDHARGHGVVVHDSARNLISDVLAKKSGIEFVRLKKFKMLSVVKIHPDRRNGRV